MVSQHYIYTFARGRDTEGEMPKAEINFLDVLYKPSVFYLRIATAARRD